MLDFLPPTSSSRSEAPNSLLAERSVVDPESRSIGPKETRSIYPLNPSLVVLMVVTGRRGENGVVVGRGV